MSKATDMADRMTTRGKTYVPEYAADLLRQQEAALKLCVEALEPHKSVALRWYTPVDAALAAAKECLK
jgi:hypothetical protein